MSFIPQRISVGTISSVTGTTGTGAAGRVAYWSDATTLTSSASFTFNGTTLAVPDGAAATPGYAFVDDATTGFYRRGAGSIGIASGGVAIGQLGLDVSFTAPTANPMILKALTANSNGLRFYADTATDVATIVNGYNAALELGANNTVFQTIAANGLIGFGNNVTVTSSGGPQYVAKDGGTIGTNADPFFQLNDTNGLVGAWGFLTANSKNMSVANYTDTGSVYISANGAAGIEVSSAQLVTIGSAGGTQIHRINGDTGTAGAVSTYLKLNVNGTEYRVPLHATA